MEFRDQASQILRKFQDLPNSLISVRNVCEIGDILEGLSQLEWKDGTDASIRKLNGRFLDSGCGVDSSWRELQARSARVRVATLRGQIVMGQSAGAFERQSRLRLR